MPLCPLRRQPLSAVVHAVAGMRPDVPESNSRAIGPQGFKWGTTLRYY